MKLLINILIFLVEEDTCRPWIGVLLEPESPLSPSAAAATSAPCKGLVGVLPASGRDQLSRGSLLYTV